MNAMIYWAISFFIILFLAGIIGRSVTAAGTTIKKKWSGILIDNRGRYSLTHLQVVLWGIVFVSLLAAVFFARLFGDPGHPELALKFQIPQEILILSGISGGSAVIATTVKSQKDAAQSNLATTTPPTASAPKFNQVFMVEEGQNLDTVVDATKFQAFFITIISVIAYIIMAAATLSSSPVPSAFPGFSQDLLWLIGISHAGYLGGKFSTKI